jgi:hypothetical protein
VFRVIAAANCPVLTILNEKRENERRAEEWKWSRCKKHANVTCLKGEYDQTLLRAAALKH